VKSFIRDAELQEERQFLRYLISIIKSRNKLSLMEGVSTPGQARVSNTLSCDMMQGSLFSPPVPAASFEKLLKCGEPLPQKWTLAPPAGYSLRTASPPSTMMTWPVE